MIKKKLYAFLLLFACVSVHPYCLVLVHIGDALPSYLYDAMRQVRFFNDTCAMYLLANERALEKADTELFEKLSITPVPLEILRMSQEHVDFLQTANLNRTAMDGFWFFTSERFLYIDDFAQQFSIADIIHLETDVMLYVDIKEIIDDLQGVCGQVGVVLDNDKRCIPGFVYFSGPAATKKVARCFVTHAQDKKVDMETLALFFHENRNDRVVDALPIIMPAYIEQVGLHSTSGHVTDTPERYCNAIDRFHSIFDAAAIGQYVGGISPRNGEAIPGFINESCLFNPSQVWLEWRYDDEGRRVPYMIFEGEAYRINNLHIHSKNLVRFLSLEYAVEEDLYNEPAVAMPDIVPPAPTVSELVVLPAWQEQLQLLRKRIEEEQARRCGKQEQRVHELAQLLS